ncbi:RES family NAD+ phosphorylase [Fodinicurvata sp. EGI_FJ10296]|uniref:RES family NAD+ phosphorylase n=1 Tax=Fodinicurvata sp. EGI_FJ10296 TaxID=3231908 RepID=UPI0034549625
MSDLPKTRFQGRTHRLIAERHPTTGPFDDIGVDPEDIRTALRMEAAATGRGDLVMTRFNALPKDQILSGPGASIVMAAFLHADEAGARFTDSSLGGWYAGTKIETAIKETVFHHERRLRQSDGGFPTRIVMRELISDLNLDLCDLVSEADAHPEILDPDLASYSKSQAFARSLRWPEKGHSANGIHFPSVRHDGGHNVCLFWPKVVPCPPIQGDYVQYSWDASGDLSIKRMTEI